MTLDPKQDRGEAITQMLDCCSDYAVQLTDWERNFVGSVQDQFERLGSLSEKQVETLEKIYVKLP
jgi:hypothetical protein